MKLQVQRQPSSAVITPVTYRTGYNSIPVQGREGRSSHMPDLIYETVRPGDAEQYFTFSYYGGEYVMETTMTMREAEKNLLHHGLHQHDYFELMYVQQGTLYQVIENERHLYTEGSLCLLNQNIRHQEEYATDFCAVFLSLPPSLIEELLHQADTYFFPCEKDSQGSLQRRFFADALEAGGQSVREYIDFIPAPEKPEAKDIMRALFETLCRQYLAPGIGATYLVKNGIIRIFYELSQKDRYRTVPLRLGTDAEAQLFAAVTALLKSRDGRISRKEVEEALNYSSFYLNRIVKRFTGQSMLQYGTGFALQKAAGLLARTDLHVSDICEQLRFSNQTQFYRLFEKSYGMTPKAYRRKAAERLPHGSDA